ncbi:MAG TPA: hypothetical protein VGY77_10660 [Gemmataceae bacterium]|nr:hypothetical protein [Gemmataceae bacterium]
MKKSCPWQMVGIIGIGMAVTALTGCQTNIAGMTLPSPHYLDHPPQYFPPTPPFPLSRELAQMEGANPGGPGAQALPPPVVVPVAPPPGPAAPPPPVP